MAISDINLRILDNIRPRVPGALDDAIKLELFSALDEFLKGSSVWKEQVTFTLEPGEMTYSITPKSTFSALITRLEKVVTDDDLQTQIRMTMAEPGELELLAEVTTEQDVVAHVICTVGDPVDGEDLPFVPEWILHKWFYGIVDGVLGKLMTQPKKPYTDERMSIFHYRRFQQAVSQAKSAAARTNLHDAQRWRFPAFA